ncbi:helix-turn-helix domain-containing protein [Arthrobacter sp. zg-Y859]|uniref:Helix-turn-helix domain-containing protein n=1 Tax=Arthrobacter jinronghuae TaxID=2964609 RepID=A0ABT1NLR4_9MICC|nr:helix-turn-helix domain-containing protein [Arthrobacter jinronghuae]MCQ1948667.1 helix-turn-helix domain-containing protein [Arthrobacter jinronghuae]MCQ1955871.1 helix-turn-helix domain-containing protein [Arthrobacter jinronghuae]UWX78520.1 helix-turn-helix domain-containing protein [Arthrobacter jinronghuae]
MSKSSRTVPALPDKDTLALKRALAAGDVTVFVDGTALRLPDAARDAVLDLLSRLAAGAPVTVSSEPAAPVDPPLPAGPVPLLTTSQAAAAAGISHTYLRNLTDAGVIPVQYRGSHRRIRMEDVQAWLESQQAARAAKAAGEATENGADNTGT